MFVRIDVCIFETKPCLPGLIFVVSSGLFNYLGTLIMFVGIYFLISPNKSLANINEITVYTMTPIKAYILVTSMGSIICFMVKYGNKQSTFWVLLSIDRYPLRADFLEAQTWLFCCPQGLALV